MTLLVGAPPDQPGWSVARVHCDHCGWVGPDRVLADYPSINMQVNQLALDAQQHPECDAPERDDEPQM